MNNFWDFFKEMGIVDVPTESKWSAILRGSVVDSMEKGNSNWGVS